MNIQIRIRPEAEHDLQMAYTWYEDQRAGLGEQFFQHIDNAFAQIVVHPLAFPIVYRDVRRMTVSRFPFVILYLVEPEAIVVLAVFHARRHPRAWKSRRKP